MHRELSDLSRQLSDCFALWISYFAVTQTKYYQLFRQRFYSKTRMTETDLVKHRQRLVDLYQTVHRLQAEHQQGLNRLLKHYLDRLAEGESTASFIPYVYSSEADSVFIAYYALYYSTTQLGQSVLALGETIHTIFELETTHLYRPF